MTKVGILDDEVIICETLNKYLLELGYEVPDYAMSYEEAVELVNNHTPDIMLLDINTNGEKNGIDFAKYLRMHHNIPLIFVSSYSDKATLEQAKTVLQVLRVLRKQEQQVRVGMHGESYEAAEEPSSFPYGVAAMPLPKPSHSKPITLFPSIDTMPIARKCAWEMYH